MSKVGSLKAPPKGMSNKEYMSILKSISTSKGSVISRLHKMAMVKHAPKEMNKYVVMVQYYLEIAEYKRISGERPARYDQFTVRTYREDALEFVNACLGRYFAVQ